MVLEKQLTSVLSLKGLGFVGFGFSSSFTIGAPVVADPLQSFSAG